MANDIALPARSRRGSMVKEDMSSPVGHALAGVAAVWIADLIPGTRGSRLVPAAESFLERAGGSLTLACAGVAMLPDLDLTLPIRHRSATHSVTAAILVTIISALVTGWVTRRQSGSPTSPGWIVRVALTFGAAYSTHLLLDWLAVDLTPPYGIQAFWPFSDQWYISGLNLLPRTERRALLAPWAIRINLTTLAWEVGSLTPILALLWLVREKALTRLAAKMARSNHPTQ